MSSLSDRHIMVFTVDLRPSYGTLPTQIVREFISSSVCYANLYIAYFRKSSKI